MKKGFTLIELIIVIAIISALTAFGVAKFNNFRNDTLVDVEAKQLVSNLQSARSMSMSGEIEKGKSVSDYVITGADTLPEYRVSVTSSSYTIYRDFIKGGITNHEVIKTVTFGDGITVSPLADVTFARVSGDTSGVSFTVEKVDVTDKKQVTVTADGAITVQKI